PREQLGQIATCWCRRLRLGSCPCSPTLWCTGRRRKESERPREERGGSHDERTVRRCAAGPWRSDPCPRCLYERTLDEIGRRRTDLDGAVAFQLQRRYGGSRRHERECPGGQRENPYSGDAQVH